MFEENFIKIFKGFWGIDVNINIRYARENVIVEFYYSKNNSIEVSKYLEFIILGLEHEREEFKHVYYNDPPVGVEVRITGIIFNKHTYIKQKLNIWKYFSDDLGHCNILIAVKEFDEELERRRGLE